MAYTANPAMASASDSAATIQAAIVTKSPPIYTQGDLNGDGEDEIVVQMYSNRGGNSYVNHFVVYDKNLTPMGYTQVDDLDEDLPTMGLCGQTADEVKVEDGKLFVDYL